MRARATVPRIAAPWVSAPAAASTAASPARRFPPAGGDEGIPGTVPAAQATLSWRPLTAAYLILGASPGAGAGGPDGPRALAGALAEQGHRAVVATGPLAGVRARRRRFDTIVTFDGAHLAARA